MSREDLGANIQKRVTGGIWSSCVYEPSMELAKESLRRLIVDGRMNQGDLRIQPLGVRGYGFNWNGEKV